MRITPPASSRRPDSGRIAAFPPTLENGDHLPASEFLRRYEARDDLRQVQLIEGIVQMASPISFDLHALPDGMVQLWLGTYAAFRPGIEASANSTLILDTDNVVQPDAILCSAPRKGGRIWLNGKGYLCGSPELVCEIAASSASVDLHEKFRAYQRNGVQEYLVWLTEERCVRWFHLVEQRYTEMKEKGGRLTSLVFPGLVLDVKGLLKFDRARVIAALPRTGQPPA